MLKTSVISACNFLRLDSGEKVALFSLGGTCRARCHSERSEAESRNSHYNQPRKGNEITVRDVSTSLDMTKPDLARLLRDPIFDKD